MTDEKIKEVVSQLNTEDYQLVLTCGMFPEQYDFIHKGVTLGYLRCRYGYFRVLYIPIDEYIYQIKSGGWEQLDEEERIPKLREGIKKLLEKINYVY